MRLDVIVTTAQLDAAFPATPELVALRTLQTRILPRLTLVSLHLSVGGASSVLLDGQANATASSLVANALANSPIPEQISAPIVAPAVPPSPAAWQAHVNAKRSDFMASHPDIGHRWRF